MKNAIEHFSVLNRRKCAYKDFNLHVRYSETSFSNRMTQLQLINKHHISLYCECGHDKTFSVQELLEGLRPDTTVNQVADKARCTVCGRKGDKEFRLYWKCG